MSSSLRLHRNLAVAAAASFLVGASSVHCGSNGSTAGNTTGSFGGSTTGTGTGNSTASSMGGSGSSMTGGFGGDFTIDVQTKDYSAEDFFNNDPPPMTCDGGGMAPVVSGTPECPSDKNLPGCPCQMAGQTAACWTGFRKNRDHGDCKDGTTTCMLTGESQLGWGMCMNEVLPVAGATGKTACECFSAGHWQIANLEPCFLTVTDGTGNMTTTAYASTPGNPVTCPFDSSSGVPTVPASWSPDTLEADCTGNFTLCYALKAGDGKNPKATDCTVTQVCTTSYYSPAGTTVMFPPLPGWTADPAKAACVQAFINTGGYGEMSVNGQSDECELINKVFQHVTYCPLACNDPNPPAMCAMCSNGGGGSF